ncbi:MAG: hypothetical protein LBR74_06800 [Eubacterium sp.]|jgi:hypothetical protein|nr:hypothetical protein [Eubacterium sp.]
MADKKATPKVPIMEHLNIAEFNRGQSSRLLKERDLQNRLRKAGRLQERYGLLEVLQHQRVHFRQA